MTDRAIASYDALLGWLDTALPLNAGKAGHDAKIGAEIALDICDLVRLELDDDQTSAVDAARRYWNSELSDETRLVHLAKVIGRRDKNPRAVATSDRNAILDRLIICALNTNTGLSVMAGEYLAELAEALGLPAATAGQMFSKHLRSA